MTFAHHHVHTHLHNPLHEKIALRRLLQNFLCRLDETITTQMAEKTGCLPPPHLRFDEQRIIHWDGHQRVFTPNTYELLKQLFHAEGMTVSKEDVRQDVLYDADAREGSIRQCVLEARKEIKSCGFPYWIETITRKGYRLVKTSREEHEEYRE